MVGRKHEVEGHDFDDGASFAVTYRCFFCNIWKFAPERIWPQKACMVTWTLEGR